MIKNVGNLDRIARIVVGLGIIALGIAFRSWFGLVGLIPLATAAVGSCPLYLPFGLSTRRRK